MQNMNFYYDFSGQKFGHPLSLSMNNFQRQAFSHKTSLELSYVLQGEHEVFTETIGGHMASQELLIVAPEDLHFLRQIGTGEHMLLTIHIDFDLFAPAMVGEVHGAFQTLLCSEHQNAQLYHDIKIEISKLVTAFLKEERNLFSINAIMAQIVYLCANIKENLMEELPLQSMLHENYRKAIAYINKHSKEPLTLETLAKVLSFSTSYTSRLFKKYSGLPFVKYLAYIRVRASIEDLLSGKHTIEQIALDWGLPNAKAYTTTFKELYGTTPKEYRKQLGQNTARSVENTKQPTALDAAQKQLLAHLLTTAPQGEAPQLAVTKEEEHTVYEITTPPQSKTTITQCGGNITITILP